MGLPTTRWGRDGVRPSESFIFLPLYVGDLLSACQKQQDSSGHSQLADSQERGKGHLWPSSCKGPLGPTQSRLSKAQEPTMLVCNPVRVSDGQTHPTPCSPLNQGSSLQSSGWAGCIQREAIRGSFLLQRKARKIRERQIVCLLPAELTKQNYEQAKTDLSPDSWTWICFCIWLIQLIKCLHALFFLYHKQKNFSIKCPKWPCFWTQYDPLWVIFVHIGMWIVQPLFEKCLLRRIIRVYLSVENEDRVSPSLTPYMYLAGLLGKLIW